MCGIAGIFNYKNGRPVDENILRRMNNALAHRGPDDSGYHIENNVGLAMRRLSIIDLKTGHQPIANEDKSVWLTLNGEIYNFKQLRSELEAKGHKFATNSDAESALHAYEQYGPDFAAKLRGMFALAIWDGRDKKLILARDRFGKKPLFYADRGGTLCWSSELPSLKQAGWPEDLDFSALDMYLGLQYIPSPRTIYRTAKKLQPAHLLEAGAKGVYLTKYWEFDRGRTANISYEDAKSEIRARLSEAVKIRLQSDVPLGAFLSGGLDSTVIVGLMSMLSRKTVQTFTIGFEDPACSEAVTARQTAAHFKTEHHELIVKPQAAEILPVLAAHFGEPFGDSSALPSYCVAKETKKYVTVALSGEGGDENFGGYPRYAQELGMAWIDEVPRPVKAGLRQLSRSIREIPGSVPAEKLAGGAEYLGADASGRYLKRVGIFSATQRRNLYKSPPPDAGLAESYMLDIFQKAPPGKLRRLLYADFSSYLSECLMTKADITSMAVSLETRMPFLDHEFAQFVFSLPDEWKIDDKGQSKAIFRDAFRDLIPPQAAAQKKMGFAIPVHKWFRGELNPVWNDRVMAEGSFCREIFRKETLRELMANHLSGRKNDGYRLWTLTMLELWHENRGSGPARNTPPL